MGSIFKLPSGKFYAQVNFKGARKSKSFEKKSDALQWVRIQEGQKGTGTLHKLASVPALRLLDSYLETANLDRHATSTIRLFFQDPLFDCPIGQITTDLIDQWIDKQLNGQSVTKHPLKPSSVSRRLCTVSTFFNWAVKKQFIQTNPVSGHQKVESVPHRERTVSDEEIETLMNCADWQWGEPPENKTQVVLCAFLLSCNTGMRSGELLRIERSWIDGNVLHIPQEVTKTKRSRTVMLNKKALELLELVSSLGNYPLIFGLSDSIKDALWRKLRDKANLGPKKDSKGRVLIEGRIPSLSKCFFIFWVDYQHVFDAPPFPHLRVSNVSFGLYGSRGFNEVRYGSPRLGG